MKTTEKLQSAVRCITLLVLLILSVTQSIGQEKEVALALQEGYQAIPNAESIMTAIREETYSCRIHITFSNGDEEYKGHGNVYIKGFMSTSIQSFETDEHGYATIT